MLNFYDSINDFLWLLHYFFTTGVSLDTGKDRDASIILPIFECALKIFLRLSG